MAGRLPLPHILTAVIPPKLNCSLGYEPPSSDVRVTSGLSRWSQLIEQHFILNGKDGVFGDVARISSRFHCGREDRVVGSLAAGGVAQSDWAGVWQAVIFHLCARLPGSCMCVISDSNACRAAGLCWQP